MTTTDLNIIQPYIDYMNLKVKYIKLSVFKQDGNLTLELETEEMPRAQYEEGNVCSGVSGGIAQSFQKGDQQDRLTDRPWQADFQVTTVSV